MRKGKGRHKRSRPKESDPITAEGDMPQKRFYRSRAHCNPLSFNENFDYPTRPDLFDWTEEHYPDHPSLKSQESNDVISAFHNSSVVRPNVLDVGCGFGGLTIALSPLLPTHTILGLEIRAKVTEYVRLRIVAHRKEHPGRYQNCSVMRTNAMKYLVNYFPKASLDKIFFCFPDPHFKKKNHPRRIVSERLLSEYAYLLKPGGRLYCITDVKDLHDWHVEKCSAHPLFVGCTTEEMEDDPCVELMRTETEEGKKVEREGRFGHDKYYMVYTRIDDKEEKKGLGSVTAENFFEIGQFGVEVFDNEKKC
jgi:tRNA (guanine-N7-)-methyltransferase